MRKRHSLVYRRSCPVKKAFNNVDAIRQQRNEPSGFDIGNKDHLLKCNDTADVGAASMHANAVSTFAAGTGSKESDAVASTNDFTGTSGIGEVGRNSKCAPSTSSSTACSQELPVVRSTCSAPVELQFLWKWVLILALSLRK